METGTADRIGGYDENKQQKWIRAAVSRSAREREVERDALPGGGYEERTKKRAGANDRGLEIKWNSARAEL